ncbi:MAG TPA: acyltransferase family protein [Candidatus Limnocylindria bacterium]|nr:acyltransferase family protein [Candidatus Limnocylindria bacterium]
MPADASRSPRAPADLAFTSYLRIVAIAGVVMIHVMAGLATNQAAHGSIRWWIANILDSGSAWAVPVFLMVSGALVLDPEPPRTPGEFYRRRLQRVAIPLIVAHVVYFAERPLLLDQRLTTRIVIRDLLNVDVAPHLYFFWIIAGLYVIAPLLRSFIAARPRREGAWLGVAAMAWMLLVTLSVRWLAATGGASTPWAPPMLTLFLPYVGYFVLGFALRDVVLSRALAVAVACAFVLAEAAQILVSTGALTGRAGGLLSGGYQGIPVAIASVALFLLARRLIGPRSLLASPGWAIWARRIGDLTLGVFVFHLVVKLVLQRTVLAGLRPAQILPDALLLFAAVLAATFLLCAIIARVPLLRRSIGL